MRKSYWRAKGLQGFFLARTPEITAPVTQCVAPIEGWGFGCHGRFNSKRVRGSAVRFVALFLISMEDKRFDSCVAIRMSKKRNR